MNRLEFRRYAGVCHVRNRDGAHRVLAGRRGPVMVLILPHEPASGRQAVQSPQFFGVIVPARQGSIAVLGEAGEALQETADRVASADAAVNGGTFWKNYWLLKSQDGQ
ncbi:MAG: DUF3379 domain-containing protein [Pseudomonadota bacterium]|nr:DUF3379 domain-containing protein [Pseudomonadota bacterium]